MSDTADSVEFSSSGEASVHRGDRMGVYVKTDKFALGRPVFRQVDRKEGSKQYFLFVGPGGCWRVAPKVSSYSGSLLKHPQKNTTLPPRSGWCYYLNDKWNKDDSLEAIVKIKGETVEVEDHSCSKNETDDDNLELKFALMEAMRLDMISYTKLEEDSTMEDCKDLLKKILKGHVHCQVGPHGQTSLMLAASHGWEEVCKVLMSHGADVNQVTTHEGERNTALENAVLGGYPKVCDTLLLAGADIKQIYEKNHEGQTLLEVAQANEFDEVIEVLEHHGAWAEASSSDRIIGEEGTSGELTESTAFQKAVKQDYWSLRRQGVIGYDVDLDDVFYRACDVTGDGMKDYGVSPLMAAAMFGFAQVCKLLISKDDKTYFSHIGTESYVRDDGFVVHSADINTINTEDGDEENALMYAAYGGYPDVCEVLLAAGADVNMKNKEGKTALDIAKEKGHDKAVQVFEKYANLG